MSKGFISNEYYINSYKILENKTRQMFENYFLIDYS